MGAILESMVSADVIVLATPVYYYAMNGQMKTLIDRTLRQIPWHKLSLLKTKDIAVVERSKIQQKYAVMAGRAICYGRRIELM